jgi:hypothetical protein
MVLLCFIIIAGRVLSLTQDIAISSEKELYPVLTDTICILSYIPASFPSSKIPPLASVG